MEMVRWSDAQVTEAKVNPKPRVTQAIRHWQSYDQIVADTHERSTFHTANDFLLCDPPQAPRPATTSSIAPHSLTPTIPRMISPTRLQCVQARAQSLSSLSQSISWRHKAAIRPVAPPYRPLSYSRVLSSESSAPPPPARMRTPIRLPRPVRPTRPVPTETPSPSSPPPSGSQVDAAEEPLAGSIQSHRALVLLHSPLPISALPARHSTQLQRELLLRLGGARGGVLVNWVWFGENGGASDAAGAVRTEGAALRETKSSEEYAATVYTANGRLDIPAISLANVEKVVQSIQAHISSPSPLPNPTHELHFYVCTHGARDCRCGEMGGAVARALRDEVASLPSESVDSVHGKVKVRVGELAHVGGHKYAANLLVYPPGDWWVSSLFLKSL